MLLTTVQVLGKHRIHVPKDIWALHLLPSHIIIDEGEKESYKINTV